MPTNQPLPPPPPPPPAQRCTGYLVAVSAGAPGDLELVAKASRSSGAAAWVVSADAAGDAASVAAAPELPAEAEGRPGAVGARRLPAAAAGKAYVVRSATINMTPGILTGLLVGLLLLFFTLVGLSCVASVRVPDVLHSTTLPAGKEY